MFDLGDLLDGVQTVAILISSFLVVAVIATCAILYHQRNDARAEVARLQAEAAHWQVVATNALTEAKRHREEFAQFKAWVAANPAPKDPEALRRWILEAGKR